MDRAERGIQPRTFCSSPRWPDTGSDDSMGLPQRPEAIVAPRCSAISSALARQHSPQALEKYGRSALACRRMPALAPQAEPAGAAQYADQRVRGDRAAHHVGDAVRADSRPARHGQCSRNGNRRYFRFAADRCADIDASPAHPHRPRRPRPPGCSSSAPKTEATPAPTPAPATATRRRPRRSIDMANSHFNVGKARAFLRAS